MRSRVAGLPVAPMAFCAVVAAVIWLATGVTPLELLGFAAYQAVFVLGPGLLVLRLLRPTRSPLSAIALGWPVGFALELSAFALTAMAGARWLFFVYPLLVLAGTLPLLLRRQRGDGGPEPALPSASAAWATAAVTAVAILLVTLGSLVPNPLPRSVPDVALYNDLVFDVSLAADAANRWPITDPNVAGESLRYHVLVFWEAAAVHQVTGVQRGRDHGDSWKRRVPVAGVHDRGTLRSAAVSGVPPPR